MRKYLGKDAVIKLEALIEKLGEMGLDVFELCENPNPNYPNKPHQFLYLESDDRELFDRAKLMVADLTSLKFDPILNPDVILSVYVLTSLCARWYPLEGRGRISVNFPVPVTNDNRHELDQEYVRIHAMIPRSQVQREPVQLGFFDDEEDVCEPTMP